MNSHPSDLPPASRKQQAFRVISSFLALAGLVSLLFIGRKFGRQLDLPEINSQATAGMIFLVGLLSGLHCVGMCGTFIVGYTAKDAEQGRSAFRPHILYSAGKTLSYALFGAFFGFAGSLFRITPFIGGLTVSLAGGFLILYGLNMLGICPGLKAVRIKQPIGMINYAIEKRQQSRSPFFIGFFSGFILGCGPLQVMYVLAAGNGSAVEGAKSLAIFGLGTLPALLGFGMLARLLSDRMTRRFIQASALILIVMGLAMLSRGFMNAASAGDFNSLHPKCNCSR